MTRKRPEAIAPAAGTSGTSQSTYCGEKLLANATKPATVAAAAISGSGRRRQQSQTTSATAARLTSVVTLATAFARLPATSVCPGGAGFRTTWWIPSRLRSSRKPPPRLSTSSPRFSCTQ